MKHGYSHGKAGKQTERGNDRGSAMASASGRYPESSKGAFRAMASPSPSMSKAGTITKEGTVGSTRDDSARGVMSHNPYPNGIA